jgi:F-type H+-transporting ATPase subunit delta
VSVVARRYAKALFELGQQGGDFESVGRDLGRLAAAFDEPQLRRFAQDTTLDRATRRRVAARFGQRLGASRLLANFLGVLAEHNRLRDLGAIAAEYERREDRARNRVRARVVSAHPLSDESRVRINQVFERKTGKQVIAAPTVDPQLLGGVVVALQGRVFDGSLRTQLERLKRTLAG